MKKLNKVFIAAIAATAMTACNNELSEQFASNQGGDVKFTMGIEGTSASRVAMEDGSYQASFESTNAVGIFVKEVDSYSNLEYTYNGNAWTGAAVSVPADGVYTYSAYYPYTDGATATAITTEVQADQETSGYLANDFLMSSLTATAGQTNVGLQFTHALSLVEVTLSGPNAADDATVTLSNMITDATINLETSTVTPGQTKGNVTMDNLTAAMKYRAIVPEQTVAQGTELMTITSKGRIYKVSYKESDVKFEKGKYISLNVALGSSSAEDYTVTITSQGITNWGEGTGVTGGASVSVAELNIPLPTDGSFETLTGGWQNAKVSAGGTDKWYMRDNVDDAAKMLYSYSSDDEAIKFEAQQYTTTGAEPTTAYSRGSWNNDCIIFHSTAPLDTIPYKLSFKVKSTVDSGIVGLGVTSGGDDKLFALHDANGNYWKRTVTTYGSITPEWTEKVVIINFAKYHDSGTASNLESTTLQDSDITDVNGGVNIFFYNYTNGVANSLYLKDIKLEQYTEELTWNEKE